MKKTILLTGWLGYIGSHTCVALENAGFKTVLLDNLANSSLVTLDNLEIILGYRPAFCEADIRDRKALFSLFSAEQIDAVIHFAGLKAVGESCESPFEYYDNNIRGSFILFEEMEHAWVRNLVFSSSATVYDAMQSSPPFSENAPLGTTNPYGTTKLVVENILRDLSITKSWSTLALRYFNPIGAHPSWLIGERPNGTPNNLLPFIFEVATGKRDKVRIFGADYPTIDGSGVRDYIDVNDLADAHVAAITHIFQNSGFDAINIGTGQGTSVLEMIRLVSEVVEKPVPCEIVPRRSGDIGEAVTCVNKAQEILGWSAKKTVKESIASVFEFSRGIR